MNKEQKKFKEVIKARRNRERRMRRMENGWERQEKAPVPAPVTLRLSWWKRLLQWLKRK